jgi:hypothetical protein
MADLPPQLRNDWRVDFLASSDIVSDVSDLRRAIEGEEGLMLSQCSLRANQT